MAEMANVGLARSPTLIVATGCDKTKDLRVPGVIDIIVDEGGRMYATLTREMVLCGGYRCLSGCLDHRGKAHVRIDGSAQPFLCGMLANRRSRDFSPRQDTDYHSGLFLVHGRAGSHDREYPRDGQLASVFKPTN